MSCTRSLVCVPNTVHAFIVPIPIEPMINKLKNRKSAKAWSRKSYTVHYIYISQKQIVSVKWLFITRYLKRQKKMLIRWRRGNKMNRRRHIAFPSSSAICRWFSPSHLKVLLLFESLICLHLLTSWGSM